MPQFVRHALICLITAVWSTAYAQAQDRTPIQETSIHLGPLTASGMGVLYFPHGGDGVGVLGVGSLVNKHGATKPLSILVEVASPTASLEPVPWPI